MSNSSFATRKLNASTFLVTEDDAYGEHPLIYVKVHLTVPIIIVGDTGCDRASKSKSHGKLYGLIDSVFTKHQSPLGFESLFTRNSHCSIVELAVDHLPLPQLDTPTSEHS